MSDEHDPRFWHPISGVNPPPAGHRPTPGVNPPFAGGPERKSTPAEIYEYHKNNGSLTDEVLEYLGMKPDRSRERGGR